MRFAIPLALAAQCALLTSSLSIPDNLQRREADADQSSSLVVRAYSAIALRSADAIFPDLAKRRGGGGGGSSGGGGGGGRGGGSSSGGSSSGGSSSGGSSSGGSSSGGSRGGSTGTSGGGTRSPSFGGGRSYPGGSATPYRSGARSPAGILPLALGAGALAAIAFWPGTWYPGTYSYHYNHRYNSGNRTDSGNGTLPVQCLCDPYSDCGCDDPGDNATDVINEELKNGSARIGNVNGTRTVVVNGTLPNDTSGTASGGSGATSAAPGGWTRTLLEASGWWTAVAVVGLMVWL